MRQKLVSFLSAGKRRKKGRKTNPHPPQHHRLVLPSRRQPLSIMTPCQPPDLVRVILQDVRRVIRKRIERFRVALEEERERLGRGRGDGVVALLVCLSLREEGGETPLREHDIGRDVACGGGRGQLSKCEGGACRRTHLVAAPVAALENFPPLRPIPPALASLADSST